MTTKYDTAYYREAKNWYNEVYESVVSSRNQYRLLAIAFGILLALSFTVILSMVPLKRSFYRIIEVNQQTGEVTQLKEVDLHTLSPEWPVTRYFIGEYVQNRHAYAYEDIKRTFNQALAMSQGEVAKHYQDDIFDTNPNSPINKLGKNKYREVIVYSINQYDKNTAIIRFKTVTHDRLHDNNSQSDDYRAVLKWTYQTDLNSIDRDKTPLGFLVTYYQVTHVFSEKES